jgi:hypothetical protein
VRFNKYLMPAVAIVALLGTVLTAKVLGYWQTSGRQMIDPNAELTSRDIRGWMDLEYISEGYDIPLSELRALLGLPPDTPGHTALKDIEHVVEVSTVRVLIADHLGEETHGREEEPQDEPTAVPPTAPSPTPVPVETEPTHVPGSGRGSGTGAGHTPLPPGQTLPAADIKGRMTLQEVSEQCAIPLDVLYAELGLPDGLSPNTVLRDVGSQVAGFEVSAVRDIVATYQAAHP